MARRKETVPFKGSKEQKRRLLCYLSEIKQEQGALLGALQRAQDIYGYLPIEVQKMVAGELNIPLAEVYGVVTFYSQFTTSPKGRYNISVCLGTACYVKGSRAVLDKLVSELGIEGGECTADGMFSLEACRCIGACGLAPVLMVNEDVYGRVQVDDIPDIIKKYGYQQAV